MAITGNETFLTQSIETNTLQNSCIFLAEPGSGMQLNHSSNQVSIVFTGNVSALNSVITSGICVLTGGGTIVTRAFDSTPTVDWTVNGDGNYEANVAAGTSVQLINMALNGVSLSGSWPRINLIPGPGATLNVVGNSFTGSWDVNIDFSGTGGGSFNNPMTTAGDMIIGGTLGAPLRLPAGTSNQFLNISGGVPAWKSILAIANGGTGQTSASAAFNALSPMTTAGDIIVGGTSGAGTRLAAGTVNYVLTSNGPGVAPSYQIPSAIVAPYWVSTNTPSLSQQVNLGTLIPGLLKISVTSNVATPLSADPGVDYYAPMLTTNASCSLIEGGTKIFLGTPSSQVIALNGSAQLVSFGYQSLFTATNANGVSAFGYKAGALRTSYNQCTFLGANTDASTAGLTNSSAIGSLAVFAQSNMILLGNATRTCINFSNPDTTTISPYALQLGDDSGSITPQIMMLSSADPLISNIFTNAGVFSVNAGVPMFSNSTGNFTLLSEIFAVTIAQGGTGERTASAAFNALSPMTTAGDIIIGGTAGSGTRLAAGTETYVLTSNGPGVAPSYQANPAANIPALYSASGGDITDNSTELVTISFFPQGGLATLLRNVDAPGDMMVDSHFVGTTDSPTLLYQFATFDNVGNLLNTAEYCFVIGGTTPSGFNGSFSLSSLAHPDVWTFAIQVKCGPGGYTATLDSVASIIPLTYFPGGMN